MCWGLAPTLVLAVVALCLGCGFGQDCLCEDPDLCRSLGPQKDIVVEVFAFHASGNVWRYYDWSKITTVVNVAAYVPELLCHAHAHNVRVLYYGIIKNADVEKRTVRTWIEISKRLFMDGIILSLDKSITTDGQTYSRINVLMQEIVKGFHEEIPGSLVAIIYPWRLSCFTTHCNILPEILDQSDIIFVTSFDIPAYLDGCIAKPTSSYHYVLEGLSSFIQKGIDPRKIVMGVSWSGYDFTCNHFREAGYCELGQHSGTKAVCSIQSANTVTYEKVMQLLSKSITGRLWDDHWRNPYFAYLDGKTYHEIWYDDPESISLKSTFLKKLKLRGIGMWAANYLNYSRNAWTLMQTEAMWNALCPP